MEMENELAQLENFSKSQADSGTGTTDSDPLD